MIWTYVIASEPYDGWAKIGLSRLSPDLRLRQCQTGNPRRLYVVGAWPDDVEETLHRYYRALRGGGEWFALPAAMLEDVAEWSARERGHVWLMTFWPVDRVLKVACGPTDPVALAANFSTDRTRTAHAEAV